MKMAHLKRQRVVLEKGGYWEKWGCSSCGEVFSATIDPHDNEVMDDDGFSKHECDDESHLE